MAKYSRLAGRTSQITLIFVNDSSSTTGAGLTGLTNSTSGLTAYYVRNSATGSTSISLASMTLGTFTSGGFKEIDSTNMPGWYQFCPPNAALASGADAVGICLRGAANMAPCNLEIDLTAFDPLNGNNLGLAYLPQGPMMIKKNAGMSAYPFVMVDSTGTPRTGLTVAAQRTIDGGAWANTANPACTEIGFGGYYFTPGAADFNGGAVMFRFSATGAQDQFWTVVPQP